MNVTLSDSQRKGLSGIRDNDTLAAKTVDKRRKKDRNRFWAMVMNFLRIVCHLCRVEGARISKTFYKILFDIHPI